MKTVLSYSLKYRKIYRLRREDWAPYDEELEKMEAGPRITETEQQNDE